MRSVLGWFGSGTETSSSIANYCVVVTFFAPLKVLPFDKTAFLAFKTNLWSLLGKDVLLSHHQYLPHDFECIQVRNVIRLHSYADCAHTRILPSVTRPSSAFRVGLGTRLGSLAWCVCPCVLKCAGPPWYLQHCCGYHQPGCSVMSYTHHTCSQTSAQIYLATVEKNPMAAR